MHIAHSGKNIAILATIALVGWTAGYVTGSYGSSIAVSQHTQVASTVAASQAGADTQCNNLKQELDKAEKAYNQNPTPATQNRYTTAKQNFDSFSTKVQGSDTGGQGAQCKCAPKPENPMEGVCKAGEFDKPPGGGMMMPMMMMPMMMGGMPMLPMIPMMMPKMMMMPMMQLNPCIFNRPGQGDCPADGNEENGSLLCDVNPRAEGCPLAHECIEHDELLGCLLGDDYPLEDTTVIIKATDRGFEPVDVTITIDDTVIFENVGTVARHPVSDDGELEGFDPGEPIQPGERWEFQFTELGDWAYHDILDPTEDGIVRVNPLPTGAQATSVGEDNPADARGVQNPGGVVPGQVTTTRTLAPGTPYATAGQPAPSGTSAIQSVFTGIGAPFSAIVNNIQRGASGVLGTAQNTPTPSQNTQVNTSASGSTQAPPALVTLVNRAASQVYGLVQTFTRLFGF